MKLKIKEMSTFENDQSFYDTMFIIDFKRRLLDDKQVGILGAEPSMCNTKRSPLAVYLFIIFLSLFFFLFF